MKKIIIILLIISFVLFTPIDKGQYVSVAASMLNDVGKEQLSYLIVGFDEASNNTDVMMIINYNVSKNAFSILQIPRDSYVFYNGDDHKINSLYNVFLQENSDNYYSMDRLKLFISQSFGISLDGYAGYTQEAFVRLVDKLGGVSIEMPTDLSLPGLSLSKGNNLISGTEALTFVRHRSSYALADLSRLDAQKIFLNGLYKTLKNKNAFQYIASLGFDNGEGVLTDLKVADLVNIAIKNIGRIKNASARIATLPGTEASYKDGASYYFISSVSSNDLLETLSLSKSNFDKSGYFKCSHTSFSMLYYKEIGYSIIDNDNISDIRLN